MSENLTDDENRSLVPANPSRKSILAFLKLNAQHYIVLLLMLLIGSFLFYMGDESKNDVLRDTGVLLLTIFTMSFIYELVLRRLFQDEMKRLIKEAIQESRRPALQKILDMGIASAYDGIDHHQINEWIKGVSKAEIIVSNIYIPELTTRFDVQLYVKAIKDKGCSLKILISDAAFEDAIRKRALATDTDLDTYISGIAANINSFRLLWKELKTPEWQQKMSVRLHHNFISSSVWGFGGFFVIGFYHYKISAVQSIQLKVLRNIPGKEGDTRYFQQIKESFQEQWEKANKEVAFGEREGMVWDDVNKCNVINLPSYGNL